MRGLQRYELDQRIGTGGLTEVFRGTGITRTGERLPVTVKRILEPFTRDEAYVLRFWSEARTASVLRHPNVVELYEVGRIDDNLFLAFEYVDGADLQRILDRVRQSRRRLTVGASLHIVYEALKGLHHVHTRAGENGEPLHIVHRELSPENVLVTRLGEVKLADVGLAKAGIRAGRVISGAIQGDPHFMAPEQLAGTRVDPRTDVYAAGMILFTLLTGHPPLAEVPLNALLPQILAGKIPSLGSIRPDLPADLVDPVMRAIRPNPADRFSGAQEFQLVLLEYANERRIRLEGRNLADFLSTQFGEGLAPEPSVGEPFSRFVMEAAGSEEAPVPEDSIVRGPMEAMHYTTATGHSPRKSAVPTVLKKNPLAIRTRKKTAARQALDLDNPDTARGMPIWVPPPPPEEPSEPRRPSPTRRSPRTAASSPSALSRAAEKIVPARQQPRDASRAVWLSSHTQGVSAVAFLHDGRHALSASADQTIVQWDLPRRRRTRVLTGHTGAVTSIAVSRDGMLAVSGGRDKVLQTWDLGSGEPLQRLEGHKGWVLSVDVSPDGTRAISGGIDPVVRLWDLGRGRELGTLKGHEDSVAQVVLFDDARRALSGSRDGTLRVWDLHTRRQLTVIDAKVDSVRAVAVSSDGRLALSVGAEPILRLWDLERRVEIQQFTGHSQAIAAVAFSADANRAVSGGYDGYVRLWDVREGTALQAFAGHVDAVLAVAFSPDGEHVLSGGADHKVGLWEVGKR